MVVIQEFQKQFLNINVFYSIVLATGGGHTGGPKNRGGNRGGRSRN